MFSLLQCNEHIRLIKGYVQTYSINLWNAKDAKKYFALEHKKLYFKSHECSSMLRDKDSKVPNVHCVYQPISIRPG